jgi:hypothetical protein
MPKHKHAELIKAWAEGVTIEIRGGGFGLMWRDCGWDSVPAFDNRLYEFRIQPPKKSAGQVLKESNPSVVPFIHWDNLDGATKLYYEQHAINFLAAWKKENE